MTNFSIIAFYILIVISDIFSEIYLRALLSARNKIVKLQKKIRSTRNSIISCFRLAVNTKYYKNQGCIDFFPKLSNYG